jgi:hypothetical protein
MLHLYTLLYGPNTGSNRRAKSDLKSNESPKAISSQSRLSGGPCELKTAQDNYILHSYEYLPGDLHQEHVIRRAKFWTETADVASLIVCAEGDLTTPWQGADRRDPLVARCADQCRPVLAGPKTPA